MSGDALPLFPLPTALVPGALLPLYVFEPRYRDLLRDCVDGNGRFGIIYHDPDLHGPFLNEPGTVGCLVTILRHRPEPDGRAWIGVKGLRRFKVVEEVTGAPYYRARVVGFEDDTPPAQEDRRRDTLALFRTVVEAVADTEVDVDALQDENDLSFAVARALRIHPAWIHELLQRPSETSRLDQVDSVLQAVINNEFRG